jgi:nucleoside-diphosphate-sugar epimerase
MIVVTGATGQLGRLVIASLLKRSDPVGSCLLGVSSGVARIIASFSLTELDRVVERRFRYVRPRWEDRPAVWRALLASAQNGDAGRTHEANLRAMHLLTGDLLASRVALH